MSQKNPLPESWMQLLGDEFKKDYMKNLSNFLKNEKKKGKVIYPHTKNIFKAFELTEPQNLKVVIIGQDPYHNPNQAEGLCFSVSNSVRKPPSLINIFKELEEDLGIKNQHTHSLKKWTTEGVLLLNSILTVEENKPGSHQNQGWEIFTDKVIETINEKLCHVAFILWGSYAQKKGKFIDTTKHYVIKSAHPSPLSSHRGFFGSKPFSKINAYLEKVNKNTIDWSL